MIHYLQQTQAPAQPRGGGRDNIINTQSQSQVGQQPRPLAQHILQQPPKLQNPSRQPRQQPPQPLMQLERQLLVQPLVHQLAQPASQEKLQQEQHQEQQLKTTLQHLQDCSLAVESSLPNPPPPWSKVAKLRSIVSWMTSFAMQKPQKKCFWFSYLDCHCPRGR